MMNPNETYIDRDVAELSREYSLIHGSNINLARITPQLIDGLKMVAKRLLYVMYMSDSNNQYRKVAAITGNVIATLHHHGQAAVYATLVNLAQEWNNNLPLIDGYGNFGSVSGDPAGADRYILARLSDYARACFFEDWKESTVDMIMGADDHTMEPVYLPSKYPNALINGVLGIGYGMSSNVPPYCFSEVVNVTIDLMKDPQAKFMLIPDSPTGCDIVAGNFQKICDTGIGSYTMRCRYEVDPDANMVTITALPYQVTMDKIIDCISGIKETDGLAELIHMNNYSGRTIKLQLIVRNDVNPYKFIKKLIGMIPGLERSYPVNITVTDDLTAFDMSVRQLLLEWIQYRREQKRVVINHKRTRIMGDQRTNDVKLFILAGNRLEETIQLFRSSANRAEIERRLVERFANSEIRMDSLQAKALSNLRMFELCEDTYHDCLKRREDLAKELAEVEAILASEGGIDRVIIAELKDGVKRFGAPRRSRVVPYKISIETEIQGESILQLSSDGMVHRRQAANAEEEPLPKEPNGFAVKVENDAAFIAIDESGMFSFINVKELPVDSEVPLNRFIRTKLGKVVALIPFDIETELCCTLVSAKGKLKRFRVSEMKPSKKPCIDLDGDDRLIKGVVSKPGTSRDILIFTREGYGQRLDPNAIRVTSYSSKGIPGFKLVGNDEIIGCYLIDPRNQYLLYVTTRGKARLNLTEYLPLRSHKSEGMVRLIQLPDRDQLLNVIGCDKLDKLRLFYQDMSEETVKVKDIPEGTMSSAPVKIVSSPMVSNRIVKVTII